MSRFSVSLAMGQDYICPECSHPVMAVLFLKNGQVEKMANKANHQDIIPLREALNMEIMINQALIDLLVAKGIITQEELMEKIDQIRKEIPSVTS